MITKEIISDLVKNYDLRKSKYANDTPFVTELRALASRENTDSIADRFVSIMYEYAIPKTIKELLDAYVLKQIESVSFSVEKDTTELLMTHYFNQITVEELLALILKSSEVAQIICRDQDLLTRATQAECFDESSEKMIALLTEVLHSEQLQKHLLYNSLSHLDIKQALDNNTQLRQRLESKIARVQDPKPQIPTATTSRAPTTTTTTTAAPTAPTANITPENNQQWKTLLVNMLQCVKRDADGQITGIDPDARKTVLKKALIRTSKGPRFPEYIKNSNAGNIVYITKRKDASKSIPDRLKTFSNVPQDIQNRLNFRIAMGNRFDTSGKPIGLGLYGGLSTPADENSRQKSAVRNSVEKLTLAARSQNDEQKIATSLRGLAANANLLAYSIHDTGYLTNSFLPNAAFLETLNTEEAISKDVYSYYKGLLDRNKQNLGHLLKDPQSLSLAISNTYFVNLDDTPDGTSLMNSLTDERTSEPFKFVKYQLQYTPMLCALYPQDYSYRHEFYSGILPTLRNQLSEEEPLLFEKALESATSNIIQRMLQDIRAGKLPVEVEGLTPSEAYNVWKNLSEINFAQYMRQNPGFQPDSLLAILRIDMMDASSIDDKMQQIWKRQEQQIISEIARMQHINYDAKIIFGVAPSLDQNEHARLRANKERADGLRLDALNSVITDNVVSLEVFESPLIAIDSNCYDAETYQDLTHSPMSRVDFTGAPAFNYTALKKLITLLPTTEQERARWISVPQNRSAYLQQLKQLSTDMLTGKLMLHPKIVILKVNNTHKAVICDESLLNDIVGSYSQGFYSSSINISLVCSRDFSELGTLIQLEQQSLAPLFPTLGEINSNVLKSKIISDNSASLSVFTPPRPVLSSSPNPSYASPAAAQPSWSSTTSYWSTQEDSSSYRSLRPTYSSSGG